MRRFWQSVAVVVMSSTLLVAGVPTAHATSSLTLTFTGTANVACGLGYIIVTGTTLPGPTCGYALSSNLCIAAEASPKKALPAGTGTCAFHGAGVITGYCEFSQGYGTSSIDYTHVVSGTTQTFIVDYVFSEVTEKLVMTGVIRKWTTGQTGPFEATLLLQRPNPVFTPAGGSCLSGTATVEVYSGQASAVMP